MIKSAGIYLLSSLLNQSLPFLLLPILTRYLSPSDYGALSIFRVIHSFICAFVILSMPINITKNFSRLKKAGLAALIGNMFLILSGSFIIILAFFLMSAFMGFTFGLPTFFFILLPVIAFFNSIYAFNTTLLRNQDQPVKFGIFQISHTAINLSISLFLIIGQGFGWEGRATGIIVSTTILGIISFILMLRCNFFSFSIKKETIVDILSISLPLIPHSLGGIIISMSDRLFINQMIDKSTVGLYSVGYSFGMVVNLLVNSFNKVWSPYLFKQLSAIIPEKKVTIVRYTYLYFLFITMSAVLLTILSHWILPFFVGSNFQSASKFIVWIALGYAFRGMYTMVFPYLVHCRKTQFLGFLTPIAAILNLILNYLLIKMNGAIGAAQATLLAWLFMFTCTWIYSAKNYRMPWFTKATDNE